jgi:hypothetical protein
MTVASDTAELATRLASPLAELRSEHDISSILEGPYHVQDPMNYDRYLA